MEMYLVVQESDSTTVALCDTEDAAQMQCAIERNKHANDNYSVEPIEVMQSVAGAEKLVKRWVMCANITTPPSVLSNTICKPERSGYMFRLSSRVKFTVRTSWVKVIAEDTSAARCKEAMSDAIKAVEAVISSRKELTTANLYLALGELRAPGSK